MIKPTLLLGMRVLTYLLWLSVVIVCLVSLTLRYWILPNIHDYKHDIEQKISVSLNQKVSIGAIEASWSGMNPQLNLKSIEIYDQENRIALVLKDVKTSLSWLTIPMMEPRLSLLTIDAPTLTIRREANGAIFVAGIPMSGPSKPDFTNWILKQAQIDVINANIEWHDDKRNAPPLIFNHFNFQLISPTWAALVGQHRFGLTAIPIANTLIGDAGLPLEIRGQFYGKDVDKVNDWRGTIYSKLHGIDVSAWRAWLDYPVDVNTGVGSLQFWLHFKRGKPTKIISDVALNNVKMSLKVANLQNQVLINNLAGRLKWQQLNNGQLFGVEKLNLHAEQMDIKLGDASYREFNTQLGSKKPVTIEAELALNSLDLATLKSLSSYLKLPITANEYINGLNAIGKLNNVSMRISGDKLNPETFQLKCDFSRFGVLAYRNIPGFSNLSGTLDINQNKGEIKLNTQQAMLDFNGILRWPIPAETLDGEILWHIKNNITTIYVESLNLTNEHLKGKLAGTFEMNGIKGGKLDFTGYFDKLNTKFAKFYYPSYLNKDTLQWLDNSIIAGNGSDIKLIIKGNAGEFPYADNKNGLFKATAKIKDGVIEYGKKWPKIDKLALDMVFQGNRMELKSTQGELLGTQINKVDIVIPDLDTKYPMLNVNGVASGYVSNVIQFINNSPVLEVTDGFTQNLNVTGLGKLNIKLDIPLSNTNATKLKGSYIVSDSMMSSSSIPDINHINGQLDFTETGISGKNIRASIFDSPGTVNIVTNKDHVIRINANGRMPDSGLKKAFNLPILNKIEGSADWASEINIKKDSFDLTVHSTLVGMAVDLPAPFNKSKTDAVILKLDKKPDVGNKDFFSINYGTLLSANLITISENHQLKLESANIGVNELADYPTQTDVAVHGNLARLDLDEWSTLNSEIMKNSARNADNRGLTINSIVFNTNELTAFDRQFHEAKINAKVENKLWKVNLQSREMNGDLIYNSIANGKLTARLSDFSLPDVGVENKDKNKSSANIIKKDTILNYPALDVIVEDFEISNKKLGRLEVIAAENNQNWNIEKLKIINPESELTATGEWRNWRTLPNTKLNFSLNINNLGKFFKRFGYPETIKSGDAMLTGQLQWPGSPHEYNSINLDGNLLLEANKGRIVKVETGIGRLFSLLSLQNLPRRLALDFKDVFNDGFAFDTIKSTVRIDRGIVRSDDFKMVGPTAQVQVKGETNLAKESQHLFIKVTPYISDTLSLAAFAGGPVVGIGAYIAQKLLRDPLNKFAVDEYEIVGTWSDPQEVEKKATKAESATNNGIAK